MALVSLLMIAVFEAISKNFNWELVYVHCFKNFLLILADGEKLYRWYVAYEGGNRTQFVINP